MAQRRATLKSAPIVPIETSDKRPSRADISEVIRRFQELADKRRNFIERFGHARLPVCTRGRDGKWIVAVSGGLYQQTQENPYGFVNVIYDYALNYFGIPFLEVEEAKPIAERHPAIQWMHTYVEHSQRMREEGNTDRRREQIGSGAAWLRFAYDLFTIGDNSKLEVRMKERLLDPRSFQAARHELRVAVLCVVAGFVLEFEDEQDVSQRHPEFTAIDKFSTTKIAVEVRCRSQRAGSFRQLAGLLLTTLCDETLLQPLGE